MAITNGYVTLAEAKAALRITDTDDDTAIELAVESASRLIDGECRRHFYADGSATSRVFEPTHRHICFVDDISTTTGLVVKTDTGGDGTYATTVTDYELTPTNGRQNGQAWPYMTVRAIEAAYFPCDSTRTQTVEVTADWGWPAVPASIKQACLIQAVSLFKGKDAPLGVAGFGDVGEIRMSSVHPHVRPLIDPFRRDQFQVA